MGYLCGRESGLNVYRYIRIYVFRFEFAIARKRFPELHDFRPKIFLALGKCFKIYKLLGRLNVEMLLKTHMITSSAVVSFALFTLLDSYTLDYTLIYLTVGLGMILAILIDSVIDKAGHKQIFTYAHGIIQKRVPLTHDIVSAPIIGGFIGFIYGYAFMHLLKGIYVLEFLDKYPAIFAVAGILAALTHLFLDSLTEAGIFIFGKRFRIAGFSYDNIPLNVLFWLLSLMLLLYVFQPQAIFSA